MKAVVFVDVQKDFIDGALKNDKAIEVTPKIVEFAKDCIEKGYKLYATRDTHEKTEYSMNGCLEKTPAKGYLASCEGKKLPVEHCIEGTDGWMIDNRLMEVLEGKCTFVNKPIFGSFDLIDIIKEDFFETYQYVEQCRCPIKCLPRVEGEKLDEIILCGFCTGICVISNALMLKSKFPEVNITVMKDLCACVTPESHVNALEAMKLCQVDVK